MLKRMNRLSSDYEFNTVRKYGRNVPGRFFYFYYLKPRSYKGPAKAGIVVSKKFSKKAVVRNRIKRQYREILRLNFDRIPEGFWVVIYPKFSSFGKEYEELSSDFTKTVQKISFTA